VGFFHGRIGPTRYEVVTSPQSRTPERKSENNTRRVLSQNHTRFRDSKPITKSGTKSTPSHSLEGSGWWTSSHSWASAPLVRVTMSAASGLGHWQGALVLSPLVLRFHFHYCAHEICPVRCGSGEMTFFEINIFSLIREYAQKNHCQSKTNMEAQV